MDCQHPGSTSRLYLGVGKMSLVKSILRIIESSHTVQVA